MLFESEVNLGFGYAKGGLSMRKVFITVTFTSSLNTIPDVDTKQRL